MGGGGEHENLVLSTKLIRWIGHCEKINAVVSNLALYPILHSFRSTQGYKAWLSLVNLHRSVQ